MSQPDPNAPDPHIGKTIDSCRLERKLGQGGMGIAYLATHSELERSFVIKILNPSLTSSQDTIQRFYREAQSVAKLNHPNVVAIANVGQDGEFHFIRMEFIDGVTLESLIRAQKKVPWRRAARIAERVALGLAHAHERKIIHRDIKPENIMIDEKSDAVKVMDFGLAKQVQGATKVSVTGQIVGTPFFMSPEQAGGKQTDARSDLYSLGVTLYYMLTGVKPFNGKNLQEIFLKHFFYTPESPKIYTPDLPDELGEIIRKTLKKKKKERYQSAQQLANDLKKLLEKEAEEAPEPSAPTSNYLDLRAPPTEAESRDVAAAMVAAAREGGAPTRVEATPEREYDETAVRAPTYVAEAQKAAQDQMFGARSITSPDDDLNQTAVRAPGSGMRAGSAPTYIGAPDTPTGVDTEEQQTVVRGNVLGMAGVSRSPIPAGGDSPTVVTGAHVVGDSPTMVTGARAPGDSPTVVTSAGQAPSDSPTVVTSAGHLAEGDSPTVVTTAGQVRGHNPTVVTHGGVPTGDVTAIGGGIGDQTAVRAPMSGAHTAALSGGHTGIGGAMTRFTANNNDRTAVSDLAPHLSGAADSTNTMERTATNGIPNYEGETYHGPNDSDYSETANTQHSSAKRAQRAEVTTVNFRSASQVFSNEEGGPVQDPAAVGEVKPDATGRSLLASLPIPPSALLALVLIIAATAGAYVFLSSQASSAIEDLNARWLAVKARAGLSGVSAIEKETLLKELSNFVDETNKLEISGPLLLDRKRVQEVVAAARKLKIKIVNEVTVKPENPKEPDKPKDPKPPPPKPDVDLYERLRRRLIDAKQLLRKKQYARATVEMCKIFEEARSDLKNNEDIDPKVPVVVRSTPSKSRVTIVINSEETRTGLTPVVFEVTPFAQIDVTIDADGFEPFTDNRMLKEEYRPFDPVLKRRVFDTVVLDRAPTLPLRGRRKGTLPQIEAPPVLQGKVNLVAVGRDGLLRGFGLDRSKIRSWLQPVFIGEYGDPIPAPTATDRAIFCSTFGWQNPKDKGGYFTVCAIDPTDGTISWRHDTGSPCPVSPRVYPGIDGPGGETLSVLVTGTLDGRVVFLDLGSGEPLTLPGDGAPLSFRCEDAIVSSPLILGRYAYAASADRRLWSIDWMRSPPTEAGFIEFAADITSGPVALGELLLLGTADGSVHAIERRGDDGIGLRWSSPATGLPVVGELALSPDAAYFATSANAIGAVRLSDGQPLKGWGLAEPSTNDIKGIYNPPVYDASRGLLYALMRDGRFFALDPETGRIRWDHLLEIPRARVNRDEIGAEVLPLSFRAAPTLLKDRILVLSVQGDLFALAR